MENIKTKDLSVYQYPASGNIRIDAREHFQTVAVYNSIGELIKLWNGNTNSLQMSLQATGEYLLRMERQQEVIHEKVVVNYN